MKLIGRRWEVLMISGLPWGLALTSGVNTYLPLFLLALFARYSHVVEVSPRFQWLVSDQAMLILGVLTVSEILAEKFPVLDHLWDFAHTLVRPVAGALAAGATLSTDQAFEIIAAMLMGGSLAVAAHAAKSSIRLVSTSKSLGAANPILSFAEDAAVVVGTLLSLYAPWVMLGLVLLFVLLFALLGPRLFRTLSFDLRIMTAWFGWLWRKIWRVSAPANLQESLLELTSEQLRSLGGELEPGENLLGALPGWKRSSRGPRAAWLLVCPRRLLLVERRLWRKPRLEVIPYTDLTVARYRGLALFARVDLLTRHNASYALSLRKTHAPFGAMAVERICELAGLPRERGRSSQPAESRLASVPR